MSVRIGGLDVIGPLGGLIEARWASWVDGPRGIAGELIRAAPIYGVRLTITTHDKRWFSETVAFEVTGSREACELFRDSLAVWLANS